jgi:hypothetical protein
VKHEVEPIEGEAWRFYVRSRTPGEPPHLVDLAEYDGNGECACKHFEVRFKPDLERGINRDWLRCYHILRARGFVLNAIIAASKQDAFFGEALCRVVRAWFVKVIEKIGDRTNEAENKN